MFKKLCFLFLFSFLGLLKAQVLQIKAFTLNADGGAVILQLKKDGTFFIGDEQVGKISENGEMQNLLWGNSSKN